MKHINLATSVAPTTRKRGKKLPFAILALALSGILLFGSLFAYFSSKIGGEAVISSGDVKIIGTGTSNESYTISRYNYDDNTWTEYQNSDILNPGDFLKITASVESTGSKSAWLNIEVALKDAATVDADDMFKYYDASDFKAAEQTTIQNIVKADPLAPAVLTDSSITLGIIDGSVESETVAEALKNTVLTSEVMYIYFDKAAGNTYADVPYTFDITWRALQYRNNTTMPQLADWTGVDSDNSTT